MFLKTAIVLLAVLATATSHTFQTLFTEQDKLYTYSLKANVSTGTLAPIPDASYWVLEGGLTVHVYDDFGRARIQLNDLKTQVHTKHGVSTDQSAEAVHHLTAPFEVDICFSSIHVGSEPVWVTNIKRALAFNFLVAEPNGSLNSVEEPCLHGSCIWVYSRVGSLMRKYCAGVARRPVTTFHAAPRCNTPRLAEWRTRAPIDTDPNYLMTAERNYYLDDKIGLMSMGLKSEFQYKTHDHILSVMTDLTLKYESSKSVQSTQKLNLTESSIQYASHNYSNPSNGIWNTTQTEMKNRTYEMLLNIARKGIDSDNIVRNASLIHSLDFIDLLNTMSQLSYESLCKLFADVLGTSYELETSRNIFLEVLPYVRTEAGAKLVRHLVVDLKNKIEDSMLVGLIRKLPYSIAVFSKGLLQELEVFTKLGPDFPQDIRHAAILSFATMVNIAMEADFDQEYFDDIYDKYLRMYNYCPQYVDRLVWLQGAANLGKSSVNYLDEVNLDTKKSKHERLWAGLASLSIWKQASLENTLPILMNETEHIQLRIIALHAILTSPLGPRDFFNVHNYLKDCKDDQLKRFWYTTMKSLENNRFYDKYKAASYYIPFLAAQLTNPGLKEWATNNYIISQEPSLDVQGPTFQLLTVGGKWSGPPELVVLEFSTGGELAFNGAINILAEGVTSNVFRRIQTSNATDNISTRLMTILKDLKVAIADPEKVHIDIVVKVFDKIVYATHVDQERFDSWNTKELWKCIEDFVRFGSHINQQVVYYPTQMVKDFPTEIGTPVRLLSTIVSFTSIRGNLTAPSTDDLTWRNDLHIRYQGTSVTSLSIDGPLQPSQHTARLQQSMVVHLPMKFHVNLAPGTSSVDLKWTNPSQNGGVAMHSRSQIATRSKRGKYVHTITSKRNRQKEQGVFFDCENPLTSSQISRQLSSKYYDKVFTLPPAHSILSTILRPISSPTLGSCGVILPPFQLQPGNSLQVSLSVDEWSDQATEQEDSRLKIKTSFGLDYYREIKENRTDYFTARGTLEVDSDGTNGTLKGEIKIYPKSDSNFSICLSGHHKSLSPFNIDFTDHPAAYNGAFVLYSTNSCSAKENIRENKFEIQYENKPYGKGKREFRVGVNGQESTSMLIKSLDLETINFFGYLDAFVLLSRNVHSKPGSLEASEYRSAVTIKQEDDEKWVNWNDKIDYKASNNAWLPPSTTAVQTLKNLGFYHECRVNNSRLDFEKQLIIGDCTNKPRFAVLKSNCDGCVQSMNLTENAVTFSTGSVIIESMALDEFRLYSSRNEHIIRSQLTGVLVYHRPNETVILVPQAYMSTACGLCVDRP
ncbi:hypothetical protein O0L34_g6566 [Tuta absoluta]|nr:hypothetical protein O0L34_g6566 [Tuta absoluta]